MQLLHNVYCVRAGSSLADPSVTELLTNLDDQVSDESSTLMTGVITSAATGLAYTTAIVADSASIDSSATIGLAVVEHQPKGLFGFTSVVWYTTEASEKITLTIERDHGTKGVMDIGYTISDGTATGGDDYTSAAGTVRFYDGDTSRTVDVALVDDDEKEAHFETFTVALSLEGPINDGAALMTAASEATVLLYDYGDGIVLAETTFSTESISSPSASEVEDLTLGWTITDNGGHSGWVDSNGFAAKDEVVGADEYGKLYDLAWILHEPKQGHTPLYSIYTTHYEASSPRVRLGSNPSALREGHLRCWAYLYCRRSCLRCHFLWKRDGIGCEHQSSSSPSISTPSPLTYLAGFSFFSHTQMTDATLLLRHLATTIARSEAV